MNSKPNNLSTLALEDISLPLYQLYQSVKKLDGQTGHSTVDSQSYLLLIETLRRGFMLTSPEELLLLCEKLWLKPYHQGSNVLNKEKLRDLFNVALRDFDADSGKPVGPEQPVPRSKGPEGPRSRANKKPIPPLIKKDNLPSELDKTMSSQQGELNISVANISGGPETSGPGQADFNDKFAGEKFLIKGIYLPVNPRRIEQSIRSYRYRLKGHGKLEVDWDKTLQGIFKKGYFDQFEFREKNFFNTSWTVLIDHSPSMIAFTAYSEEIADSIAKGNKDEDDKIFYFKNYPTSHLYYDRLQSASVPFDRFADGDKRNILVISDAGAARGYFNEERIKETLKFLRRLQKHKIAWMNPMPKSRWNNSSAELIADYTNMFDIGEGTRDSLSNIVRLFKSKITTEKM